MNDHRNHRHRASEPAWPTGDDPEPKASGGRRRREDVPERTGFWSPLWDEDEDDHPPTSPPHSTARPGKNGRSAGHARNGGDAGAHQWPTSEPPSAPRRAEPPAPPRPSPRRGAGAPVWPSAEESPTVRRPGGPHTPPPGAGGRPPAGPTTRLVRPRPGGPPRPGVPGGPDPDGPTELLPPAHRGVGPEPQLLTHREVDFDEDLNDDPDLDYDDEDQPLSGDQRKLRRKKIWKRVRRTMYVFTALMIIGPIVAFFVAYQMVEVPKPEDVAAKQGQVVTLTYANNVQMSKIVPATGNRTMVTYDELPDTVKHAVYAAEDAGFESNPGFDIKGVLWAGWSQVTGGTGGASTITQQYIKKATGNDQAQGLGGITRKATEVVKAYKMNNTYTKDDIITAYLNTIYFGRGANGIVAAGQAYFGKQLKDLTPSEAALIAGMIQLPGRDDDDAYMRKRWNYVMNQMVEKNWLSSTDRKAAAYPVPIPRNDARPQAIEGPRAHIQAAVLAEVKKETGMDLETLQRKGYTIQTTIDPHAQDLAEAAVAKVTADQPQNWLPAMTAVDPKTGEIIAYYGGKDGNGIDWAKKRVEPGSSFKPFDLVALLEKGLEEGKDYGLGTEYDGTSGRVFTPGGKPVRNAGGDSCGEHCTVAQAMKQSINTVFYDIALNTVGTQNVADAAHQAGIKAPLTGSTGGAPDGNIAIGGGTTQVSTVEMASAYGTFAANGIYRAPHLVKQILTSDGGVVWQPDQAMMNGKAAFDANNSSTNAKIARNVTESLLPIADYSKVPCADKRQCASKSGTHQLGDTAENAKAWYVGYTPQISVAVALGAEENNKVVGVKDNKGGNISGAKGPGKIWQEFMNTYLDGIPKENFSKFVPIGKVVGDEDEDGGKKSEGGKPSGNNGQTSGNNGQTSGNNGQTSGNNGNNTSTPTSTTGDDETDPPGPGGNCPVTQPLCDTRNNDSP